MELNWVVIYNLQLSGGVVFYDVKFMVNYCGYIDVNGKLVIDCVMLEVVKGSQLLVMFKFKGNLVVCYIWDVGNNEVFVQGVMVYVGKWWLDLCLFENSLVGDLLVYIMLDFFGGYKWSSFLVDLYINNVFDKCVLLYKYIECVELVCVVYGVVL